MPAVGIPTTLHASLLARLDRLRSVRLVAQIGAAIGREFPNALLRTVSRLPDDELRPALGRLVASELVFQRGAPPDAVYAFKHALVQDAAHSSLLRATRQQLHAQIAAALETHFPEVTENQPELFAQHYAEAGLVEKAIDVASGRGRDRGDTRRRHGDPPAGRRLPPLWPPPVRKGSRPGSGPPARLRQRRFARRGRRHRHTRRRGFAHRPPSTANVTATATSAKSPCLWLVSSKPQRRLPAASGIWIAVSTSSARAAVSKVPRKNLSAAT